MHRERVWTTYQSELPSDRLTLPAGPAVDTRHAYHLFTILVDEVRTGITRDRFLEEITAQGIGVGVHYLSIPEYSYYQEQFGWLPEAYPNAMRIGRQTVSLPLSARLTDRDVADVISAVSRVLGTGSIR